VSGSPSRAVILGRRAAVVAVVGLQAALLVRATTAPHREFGFRMFPEASTWHAEVVRVTADGRRVPVERDWAGYSWAELTASGVGLQYPSVDRHAAAGVENQLAFLDAALDWVAGHTPRDRETRYLEARVTYSRNGRAPETRLLRSEPRPLDG
jgi:hypothetical protein